MQNWMTPSRWVCITVHLLPQRSVFCGICLYSVMVTCECSHWFHTLQCFRLSEFIPKNNRKHQRFAQKALIRFFLCVVAQWNWALVFVVAIISLPCSLFFPFCIPCHHLTWCGNYALKSFFPHSSLRGGLQHRRSSLWVLSNVFIRDWLRSLINCYQMEILLFMGCVGITTMSLGNKDTFHPVLFYFPPLCCKENQSDYMLLYLSALHNTWKGIFDFVKY